MRSANKFKIILAVIAMCDVSAAKFPVVNGTCHNRQCQELVSVKREDIISCQGK